MCKGFRKNVHYRYTVHMVGNRQFLPVICRSNCPVSPLFPYHAILVAAGVKKGRKVIVRVGKVQVCRPWCCTKRMVNAQVAEYLRLY